MAVTEIQPINTATRPPPKAVKLLLPVWGKHYIDAFLALSLPTLLAPGNVPALAAALPCEFVFLTRSTDEPVLRDHASIKKLSEICRVEFRHIDDLIVGGIHSLSITLAYARAMRETAEAMLDTCFFMLVSDYIVADGSLKNVLAEMMAGRSGVQAGNFNVVEEDASFTIPDHASPDRTILSLTPRELVGWALAYMHPITLANIVNFPLSSNLSTNRFFWSVDRSAMIGRFYLMHPICIRPEVLNFEIGSSADYSFIPEMCPSGNTSVMMDSDSYFVVEMQPRAYESRYLRLGSMTPDGVARHLTQWTTDCHRRNAQSTIIFHAADLPPNLDAVINEADVFIKQVGQKLSRKRPQPYRDHPYWIGALAAFKMRVGRYPADTKSRPMGRGLLVSLRVQSLWLVYTVRAYISNRLLGHIPDVGPLHALWPDFRNMRDVLRDTLATPDLRLMAIGLPQSYIAWLEKQNISVSIVENAAALRKLADEVSEEESYDACLFHLSDMQRLEQSAARVGWLIDTAARLVKPDGRILIMAINEHFHESSAQLDEAWWLHLSGFIRPWVKVERGRFIRLSLMRRTVRRLGQRVGGVVQSGSFLTKIAAAPFALATVPVVLGSNLITAYQSKRLMRPGVVSSLFIVLRKERPRKGLPL